MLNFVFSNGIQYVPAWQRIFLENNRNFGTCQ